MKRILQLVTCLAVCLQMCGGPSGVLQAAAWAGMAVAYSQQDGIVEGIRKTFDGEHPCGLCTAIATMKEDGDRQPPQNRAPGADPIKYAKDFESPPAVLAEAPDAFDAPLPGLPDGTATGSATGESPPVPPPRLA